MPENKYKWFCDFFRFGGLCYQTTEVNVIPNLYKEENILKISFILKNKPPVFNSMFLRYVNSHEDNIEVWKFFGTKVISSETTFVEDGISKLLTLKISYGNRERKYCLNKIIKNQVVIE